MKQLSVVLAAVLLIVACGEDKTTYGGGFATQAECLDGQISVTEGEVTVVELAEACEVSIEDASAAIAGNSESHADEGEDVWEYTDTTGTAHRVVSDDDTGFSGGIPDPVNAIDGISRGPAPCPGVRSQRKLWLDLRSDSSLSVEFHSNADAYAAYAADVLKRLGCPS